MFQCNLIQGLLFYIYGVAKIRRTKKLGAYFSEAADDFNSLNRQGTDCRFPRRRGRLFGVLQGRRNRTPQKLFGVAGHPYFSRNSQPYSCTGQTDRDFNECIRQVGGRETDCDDDFRSVNKKAYILLPQNIRPFGAKDS